MNKKVLVTGGAGYIGSKLVKELINKGMEVIVIDDLSSGKQGNINSKAVFYNENILSKNISTIFKKEMPHIVFHLAALKSVEMSLTDPLGFAKVNILGSLNILECAEKLKIKKVIFTSTAAVYGEDFYNTMQYEEQPLNPLSPYGCSKLAIENYINFYNKVKGMQGVILRFANVYGPGGKTDYQGVINLFIEKILTGQTIFITGDGNQTRDFVNVGDIANICTHLATIEYGLKTVKDFIFNVSTGRDISVNDVLQMISQNSKKTPKVIYKKSEYAGQAKSILSPNKLKTVLDWTAKITLEEGIKETVKYYQKIYGK